MQNIGTVYANGGNPIIGTANGPVFGNSGIANANGALSASMSMNDAAIANGNAFLISELEKRDPRLRQPLTSITYPRDIPIKVGGGWVEFISALNIDYGVSNGSGDGAVHAAGANTPPVIQANLDRDTFRAHIFSIVMRIMFVDMQRSQITGRSLDQMYTDGIRLSYDKHMDQNTYIGMPRYNTTGLLNNPNVSAQNVANGAAGTSQWNTKTPDEILTDINTAITRGWENAAYDLAAIPNHIVMPYAQYNSLATTRIGELAEKTILTFLLENNVATKNGTNLVIGAAQWAQGAGAGGTDRMAVYRNEDRFIAMEELVPLARTMTGVNIDALGYDSVYMANISEVEIFYPQTIQYYDGI